MTTETINGLKVHKFKTYKQYINAKSKGLIGENDIYVIEKPETITVEAAEKDSKGNVIVDTYATKEEIADAGNGDMLKSVYDTNNDGIVDKANQAAFAIKDAAGRTIDSGYLDVYGINSLRSSVNFKPESSVGSKSMATLFKNMDDTNFGGFGGLSTNGQWSKLYIGFTDETGSNMWEGKNGLTMTRDTIAWKNNELATKEDIPTKVSDLSNDINLADTTYVDNKVASIVDTAPEALNTLNELAAALGDDPNFATTVMTEIGKKADKTAIPTVNNATLTIQKNGTNVATFTANSATNVTANISVPTKVDDLTDKADYLKKSEAPGYGDILTKTAAASTYQPKGNYQPAGNYVTSVAGKTGAVTLSKSDVQLDKVDNTADADKSVKLAASADKLSTTGLGSSSSNTAMIKKVYEWTIDKAYTGCTGMYAIYDTEGAFNGILSLRLRTADKATSLGGDELSWIAASASVTCPKVELRYTINDASITYRLYIYYTSSWKTLNISKMTEQGVAGTLVNVAVDAVEGTLLATATEGKIHRANTADKLTTARTVTLKGDVTGSATFDGSNNIEITTTGHEYAYSRRNFTQGTLITTSIDYSVESGAAFYLEIVADTYYENFPLFTQAQGYIYNNTIISYAILNHGRPIEELYAMNVDGRLCFWFPRLSYWQSFGCKVVSSSAGDYNKNLVTSVTDAAKPEGTKEVALHSNLINNITTSNIASQSVNYATSAGSAENATHANNAGTANFSAWADEARTAETASSATKAIQDASGNVITDTYATKTELNNKPTGASVTMVKYSDSEFSVPYVDLSKISFNDAYLARSGPTHTVVLNNSTTIDIDPISNPSALGVYPNVTSFEVRLGGGTDEGYSLTYKMGNTVYTVTPYDGSYSISVTDDLTVLACNTKWCLTGDTLITMSDGSYKRIDEVQVGDKVKAIDPETTSVIEDTVTYSDYGRTQTYECFDKYTFSDGTTIKTVARHRFYNVERQAMTYMDEWNIGEHAYNENGELVELVAHERINEEVKYYTIFTEKNTYFANGLLSGNRYTAQISLH